MTRTAWPTALSGDTWTAANFNTYGRDNDLAYWVYTWAGNMAYATSASALAKIATGAAGTVLQSNGSIPSWGVVPVLSGRYHTMDAVAFAPAQTSGWAWVDITGATLTLTLYTTCSILVWARVTGYNVDTSAPFDAISIRAVVNGVADANAAYLQNAGASISRNEDLGYIYLATGVAAGSRVVKLQVGGNGANGTYIDAGSLIAIAVMD